jgi:hypothetical protein
MWCAPAFYSRLFLICSSENLPNAFYNFISHDIPQVSGASIEREKIRMPLPQQLLQHAQDAR